MSMTHSDIRGHLNDALGDSGYIHDVNGDDKSGDVIYSRKGEMKKAPYKIRSGADGKASAKIDHKAGVKVTPRTVWDADEDDSASESARRSESAADKSQGSGNNDSRRASQESDTRSTGRGSDAARPGDRSESTATSETLRKSTWKPDGVLLCEAAAFLEKPKLSEAAAVDYPIKLISPGRGSSGYYPADVLKSAAESRVFKAGTQMFWNHDTDAEESARPEGDLNRLAAVTTTDAKWDEAGKDGPGLYARAKVFGDYADKVKEMGPHIGLSIRAGGDRDDAAKGPDGKPRVITALRNAASVDFVTKAGRDGKIFTEAANQGDDMDEAAILKLIEKATSPLVAENKQLREMLTATRGPALIGKHLDAVRLPAQIKTKIVEALSLSIPLDAAGQVDDKKLGELVEAKAKEWVELMPALGYHSNPAALGQRMTEAEVKTDIAAFDADKVKISERLADIFVGPKLAKEDSNRGMRKAARLAFIEGRAA